MQLEYAEKEDSYLRSKEVCENTVFTLLEIKSCLGIDSDVSQMISVGLGNQTVFHRQAKVI